MIAIPAPRTVTFTVEEGPDKLGRSLVICDWVRDDGRRRGQVFRVNVDVLTAQWERDGFTVVHSEASPAR